MMVSDEQVMKHMLALKAELEALGCKVTITPEDGDEPLTVNIVYPSDVPPDDGHEDEIVDLQFDDGEYDDVDGEQDDRDDDDDAYNREGILW
jgi:hypothetical protein